MSMSKFRIDYATAINIAFTSASVTGVIPANSQLIGITCDVPCRFRVSPLAQAVAVATDPLLTPNSEIQIIRLEGTDTNVSAIADPTTGGNLSVFRVFEA
jgi:hypothetical protein